MIEKIVEFSGSLRKNGISVSIRSIKVACDASSILNKENLQEGLAKIYLKDRSYRKRFNKVYE